MKEHLKRIRTSSILHYVDGNDLICSRRNILYRSLDAGDTWRKFIEIPCDLKTHLILRSRLARRLFRKYVYHVIVQSEDIIVFAFKSIYVFSLQKKILKSVSPIIGSRPLVLDTFNEDVYYGEYTSNPERRPISLLRSSADKSTFNSWFTFNNIRHIHSVQVDPYSGRLFATTGDNDDECFIGYFEDGNFVPLIEGSQQSRAIQLLFDKDFIYFASDAPHEENYIYRFERANFLIEKLQRIGGPVFYGFQQKNLLLFSTVCEPSKVNSQKYIELWGSLDGKVWKQILTLEKDRYHMKLFQYGQIIFPKGSGNENFLFFTPFASQYDQEIVRVPLDLIIEKLR